MAWCTCNIAAEFNLGINGLISANLRSSNNYAVTECGLVMRGPTTGDLSLSAYTTSGESLNCPGRAGTSFEWMQKIACDSKFQIYFIPGGRAKAYMEGDLPTSIQMATLKSCANYETFSASASSGPTSPALTFIHRDGHSMTYSGGPINITVSSGKSPMNVGALSKVLPKGSKLYLTSFSYEHTPPNIPVVNYSFLFAYSNC